MLFVVFLNQRLLKRVLLELHVQHLVLELLGLLVILERSLKAIQAQLLSRATQQKQTAS